MKTLVPKGFRAAGLPRGDRPRPSRHGLAIFYSETPASVAATFTTNRVKSAPILFDLKRIPRGNGSAQALLVNSGCANCCTGLRGIRDAEQTSRWTAQALDMPEDQALVASTGVIGDFLPMGLLQKEIPIICDWAMSRLGVRPLYFRKAAKAILTTDTVSKMASAEMRIGARSVRLWGCAKGAGMLHPVMTPDGRPAPFDSAQGKHATMLAFLLTDAKADPATLRRLLADAADQTFNRVTVDGDTSTNDSAFLFANGRSGVSVQNSSARRRFQKMLIEVCSDLSRQMAKDGEGASKFLEIRVEGARSQTEAQRMAQTVATSPLVKTAAHGEDSNWGRVLAAMGRSGVPFDPDRVDLFFGPLCVFRRGAPTRISPLRAREPLRAEEVTIRIRLKQGRAQGLYWTCDFTGQYVDINARYRT